MRVDLRVNGETHVLDVEPRMSLLDCLRERLGFTDCEDARGGMRTGHQRDVPHGRYRNIGGEATPADDKAAILAHAAIARHEAEGLHGSRSGRFKPRMRSAASAIASTICA